MAAFYQPRLVLGAVGSEDDIEGNTIMSLERATGGGSGAEEETASDS